MVIIDARGRLFGLLNVIDAAAALAAVAIVAAVAIGYSVFRLPPPPAVIAVEPATQPVGRDMTLRIRGRNFLPFMRVFVQETGESAKAIRQLHPFEPVTRYALVNLRQVQLFVSTPALAEVKLPEEVGPGQYDLVFFNETQQVGLQEAAFTLTKGAPPLPPPPPPPLATVRTYGAFTGLDARDVKTVVTGAKFASTSAAESVEVLTVDPPEPDIERLGVGDQMVPVKVENRVQVPATVRVRCSFTGADCRVGTTALARNADIPVVIGQRQYAFRIQDLMTDLPDAIRVVTVRARFLAQPEVAGLVKVGDIDSRAAPPRDRTRQFATLIDLSERRNVTTSAQYQAFSVQEQVVKFEARLRVPLTKIAEGWFYKGQPVKAGGVLTFETFKYSILGWVLSVEDGGSTP